MLGIVLILVFIAAVVIGYPLFVRAQRRHFMAKHGGSIL
jgi:hypothetical protein